MFQWDRNNLRKVRAHRIQQEEAEQALRNDPVLIYEQEVEGEPRFVYYGETERGRLLALIVTERDKKIRVSPPMIWTLGKGVSTRGDAQRESKGMSKKALQMPKFKNESAEADWWASAEGRAYVKQKSAEAPTRAATPSGSSLVTSLNEKKSVQIAIRLPGGDLAKARQIAERKGMGYQTLLKMLVHEGLAREARRR
jgi:uncharacterized DUF497 family protein